MFYFLLMFSFSETPVYFFHWHSELKKKKKNKEFPVSLMQQAFACEILKGRMKIKYFNN